MAEPEKCGAVAGSDPIDEPVDRGDGAEKSDVLVAPPAATADDVAVGAEKDAADEPEKLVEQQCLRVLQNKIRNLKKAIERTAHLEAQMKSGEKLDDMQKEAIRSRDTKVAIQKELEEIHRRQAKVFEEDERARNERKRKVRKDTKKKRTQKPAPAPPQTETPVAAAPEAASTEQPSAESGREDALPPEASPSTAAQEPEAAESKRAPEGDGATLSASDSARAGDDKTSKEGAADVEAITRRTVSKLLNVLHVVDCLNHEEGSMEELLRLFGEHRERDEDVSILHEQDLQAISYFVRMLTSPNGEVPHEEAVQVSTHHGLLYLEDSDEEAFNGFTYANLARMVGDISSSAYMNDRGDGNGAAKNAAGEARESATSPSPPVSPETHPRDAASPAAALAAPPADTAAPHPTRPKLHFFAHPYEADEVEPAANEGAENASEGEGAVVADGERRSEAARAEPLAQPNEHVGAALRAAPPVSSGIGMPTASDAPPDALRSAAVAPSVGIQCVAQDDPEKAASALQRRRGAPSGVFRAAAVVGRGARGGARGGGGGGGFARGREATTGPPRGDGDARRGGGRGRGFSNGRGAARGRGGGGGGGDGGRGGVAAM